MSSLGFKARVDPLLVRLCNGFLRFTAGATLADLLMTSMVSHLHKEPPLTKNPSGQRPFPGQKPPGQQGPPGRNMGQTGSDIIYPLWTDRHLWKHYLPLRSVKIVASKRINRTGHLLCSRQNSFAHRTTTMVMGTYGLIVGSFQTHQICMVFGFLLSAVSIVIVFVYVSSKDEEEGTIWTEVRKQTTRI